MTTEEKLKQMIMHYPRGEYTIDTLEISHPLMSQVYYLTREPDGITATLEDNTTVDFRGTYMDMKLNRSTEDLDQDFTFTFPDLTNELDDELDRITMSNSDPISVIYRAYISSDLSEPAALYRLQVFGVTQSKGAFALQCGATQFNWRKTGLTYNFDVFPMLRAL